MNESYFDGGLLQLIGWEILAFLITMLTLGICLPWAICMLLNWEKRHTVIEGRRLKFTGTGGGLFVQWLKWLGLTIITLGIYSFWVQIAIRKWVAKHTVFEN